MRLTPCKSIDDKDGRSMSRKFITYMQIFVNIIIRPITRKMQVFNRKIIRFPYIMIRKAATKIASITRKRETSLKDYFELRNHYVSKKLVLILCILLLMGIFFGGRYMSGNLKYYHKLYATDDLTYSGNAKVYNNRDSKFLVYKGKMVDGVYSGKGTRYYEGEETIVQYTGDFDLNMANGNGSTYTSEGLLLYNGSFANDHYEGHGVMYYPDGGVAYEGEFKNGEFDGIGKYYAESGTLLYKGQFENGLYSGSGELYDKQYHLVYLGGFSMGNYEGSGTEYHANGAVKYEGKFSANLYNGTGKRYDYNNRLLYDGTFKDGQFDGTGEGFNEEGQLRFQAEYKDGQINGSGLEYYQSGQVKYEGDFSAGLYSGAGIEYYDNENNTVRYEGSFKNGDYSGVGVFYDEDQVPLYEGAFAGGTYEGFGIEYLGELIQYTGDFEAGQYNGFGTAYNEAQEVVYMGFYQNGNPYPQGYLNINELTLKNKLGEPASSSLDSENALNHLYESPYMRFRAKKNLAGNEYKIVDVFVYDTLDIFDIDNSMTASEVIFHLGEPDKRYSTYLDVSTLSEDQLADIDISQQVLYLVYDKGYFDLIMPFSNYETDMVYIELKAK